MAKKRERAPAAALNRPCDVWGHPQPPKMSLYYVVLGGVRVRKPPQNPTPCSWQGMGYPNHPKATLCGRGEGIAAQTTLKPPRNRPGCSARAPARDTICPPSALSLPHASVSPGATSPSLIWLLSSKQRANKGTRVSLHGGFGLRGEIWGRSCGGDGEPELGFKGGLLGSAQAGETCVGGDVPTAGGI